MFALLRYFPIAGAVALLGATVLIAMLHRHMVLEHVTEHGEVSNVAMAQSSWRDLRPAVEPLLSLSGTLSGEKPASAELEIRKLRTDAKIVMMTVDSIERLLNDDRNVVAAGVLYKPFQMNGFPKLCEKRKGTQA